MALTKRGDYYYGDSQADIREVLAEFSEANAYLVHHCADAVCACGGRVFQLAMDDNEGVAVRICGGCGDEHPIGDGDEYLEDAELEDYECPCGECLFEISVGVSLYRDSKDVRWLYIGCRCPSCGLTACYGEWKNEYIGYQELLARV